MGAVAVLTAVGWWAVPEAAAATLAFRARSQARRGNFSQAYRLQEAAIAWQPGHPLRRRDAAAYAAGAQAERLLTTAKADLRRQKDATALQLLSRALHTLGPWQHIPILQGLVEAASRTDEAAHLTDWEAAASRGAELNTLAEFYSRAAKYRDEAGLAARRKLRADLDRTAVNVVDRDLAGDHFHAAQAALAIASGVDPGDAALHTLSAQIRAADEAYKLRQQRLQELALAQAAALANRNANPLKLVSLTTSVDAYGDLEADGVVFNRGSLTVENVVLEVDFEDAAGTIVDAEYTDISPDPLPAGASATFSVRCPGYLGAVGASAGGYTFNNP